MTVSIEAKLQGAAAHLSPAGLIAVAWCGVTIAAFFVLLRCLVRHANLRCLHADDYWMIAALLFLVANAILQTLQAHSLYYLVNVAAGRVPTGQPLLDQGNVYVRYEFAAISIFWTVLWCVKASFLALYYPLFDGMPVYRCCWWVVLFFSALAYVGCWVTSTLSCHPVSTYFHFGQCMKPIDDVRSNISISYSTAVDILSDTMIMLLPLRLLLKLKVSRRQKLAMVGVFCVGFMVIASAIARLTQIIGRDRSDPVGLSVWGLVESSVSVIVGSLPPLKGVLDRKLKSTRHVYSPYFNDCILSRSRRRKTPSGSSLSKGRVWGDAILLEERSVTLIGSLSHESKGQMIVQQDYERVKSSTIEVQVGACHDRYDEEARIFDRSRAQNPASQSSEGTCLDTRNSENDSR